MVPQSMRPESSQTLDVISMARGGGTLVSSVIHGHRSPFAYAGTFQVQIDLTIIS